MYALEVVKKLGIISHWSSIRVTHYNFCVVQVEVCGFSK
jgi:hypothetical protein